MSIALGEGNLLKLTPQGSPLTSHYELCVILTDQFANAQAPNVSRPEPVHSGKHKGKSNVCKSLYFRTTFSRHHGLRRLATNH